MKVKVKLLPTLYIQESLVVISWHDTTGKFLFFRNVFSKGNTVMAVLKPETNISATTNSAKEMMRKQTSSEDETGFVVVAE